MSERWWTIQLFYQARTDDGKAFRATSVCHIEAADVGAAYREAEKRFPNFRYGSIIPGQHLRFP